MSKVSIGIAAAFMVTLAVAAVSMAQEDLKAEKKQAEEADGLVIEQVCSGFPGTEGNKKKSKQKVVIKDDKIYMKNLETPNMCIVRGDKKYIWEIDSSTKTYDRRWFSYLEEMKKDRDKDRKEYTKIINNEPNPKTRLKLAKSHGYLADEEGKVSERPVAKTEITGEEKKINGFKCYHLKIYEDAKVVLDVWLTKEHKSPDGLMAFYKRLGCFCDEVVTEIKKIKDFPISLKAHLAFGALAVPIECEVSKIEKKKIDDKLFDLPQGLKRKKDRRSRRDDPPTGIHTCPICGNKFDTKRKEYIIYRLINGEKLLLCSRNCSKEFAKEKKKCSGNEEDALANCRKKWEKKKDK